LLFGAQGRLLSWLGASVYVGYGNSLTFGIPTWQGIAIAQDRANGYSNFIGGVEAQLYLGQRMKLAAGWARDFFDSIYATYYKDDRLYAYYEHNPWRSLSLRTQLALYLRSYGPLYDPTFLDYQAVSTGSTDRDDLFIAFAAEVAYRPLSWFELGARYSVLYDGTDFVYLDTLGMPIQAAFTKQLLLFHADLAY
jgi:hypothetical protein